MTLRGDSDVDPNKRGACASSPLPPLHSVSASAVRNGQARTAPTAHDDTSLAPTLLVPTSHPYILLSPVLTRRPVPKLHPHLLLPQPSQAHHGRQIYSPQTAVSLRAAHPILRDPPCEPLLRTLSSTIRVYQVPSSNLIAYLHVHLISPVIPSTSIPTVTWRPFRTKPLKRRPRCRSLRQGGSFSLIS